MPQTCAKPLWLQTGVMLFPFVSPSFPLPLIKYPKLNFLPTFPTACSELSARGVPGCILRVGSWGRRGSGAFAINTERRAASWALLIVTSSPDGCLMPSGLALYPWVKGKLEQVREGHSAGAERYRCLWGELHLASTGPGPQRWRWACGPERGWRWACGTQEGMEMGLQARGGARCSPSCPLPLPSLGCELRPVVCHGPDSVIIMVLSGFKNLWMKLAGSLPLRHWLPCSHLAIHALDQMKALLLAEAESLFLPWGNAVQRGEAITSSTSSSWSKRGFPP